MDSLSEKLLSLKKRIRGPAKEAGTSNSQIRTRNEIIISDFIPILFFLLLSIFIFRKLIVTDGIIVNGDLCKPPELGRYFHWFYPMWRGADSVSVISRLPGLLFLAPFFAFGSIFNLDTTEVLILVFIFIEFTAGISMYYASRHVLQRTYKKINPKIVVASLIAGLAYMWSVYLIHHSFHPFIRVSYALAPLLLLMCMKGLETRKMKYLIFTGFIWCIASGDVHWVVYGAILLFSYILFNFIPELFNSSEENRLVKFKRALIFHLKSFGVLTASFIGFSAYWLLPGFLMGGTSRYGTTITASSLSQWYSRATFANIIRDQGEHHYAQEMFTSNSEILGSVFMQDLIYYIGFGVFIFGIIAILLVRKNRYVRFFTLFAIFTLFIATSVNIFPKIGNWLILKAPLSGLYGWALRTPKISQFLIFSLSFLLGFTVVELLSRIDNRKNFGIRMKKAAAVSVAGLLVLSILLPGWPLASGDLNTQLARTEMPDEFDQANQWLNRQEGDFKVLWIPKYTSNDVSWNEGHRTVHDIAGVASSLPSYIYYSRHIQPNRYGIYFFSSMTDLYRYSKVYDNATNNLGKILAPLGIKYILFHDDMATKIGDSDIMLQHLEFQQDLELVQSFDFIHIYENTFLDVQEDQLFYISSNNHMLFGGLGSLSMLNSIPDYIPRENSILFTHQELDEQWEMHDITDDLIFTQSTNILDEIALSVIDRKYFLAPFDHVDKYSPKDTWSKIHMSSYPDGKLQRKGIMDAWDWEYDSGIVFTWGTGSLMEDSALTKKEFITDYGFEDEIEGFDPSQNEVELSLSTDAVLGEHSLRGVLKQGDLLTKDVVTTGKIAAPKGSANMRITLYIKALNAMNVQLLINYFDDEEEWLDRDFLFTDSGNFDFKHVSKDINIHPGSSYFTIDIQANRNPYSNSKWWIDELNIYNLKPLTKPNRLDMDFKVSKSGDHEIFIRSLKSEKGGLIDINIDGEPFQTIDSFGNLNSFCWTRLGGMNLDRGTHTISLDNAMGVNAVNLLAVIPRVEMEEYETIAKELIEEKRVIYALEAESNVNHENAEISTLYGSSASNGAGLAITEDGYSDLPVEIIKNGNYSIFIRALPRGIYNTPMISVGGNSYGPDIGVIGEKVPKPANLLGLVPKDREIVNYSFEDGWDPNSKAPYSWFPPRQKYIINTYEYKENTMNRSFEEGWNESRNAPSQWFPPLRKYIVNTYQHELDIINHSFETGWNDSANAPYFWSAPKNVFSASLDQEIKTHGEYSLRISTNITDGKTWSRMNSDEIHVEPNQSYEAEMDIRIENSNKSHVIIQGFNESSGKWDLTKNILGNKDGTGTKDWIRYSKSFSLDDGISMIRLVLNSGGILDSGGGNATAWFDNFTLHQLDEEKRNESIIYSAWLDPEIKTDRNYSCRITTNVSTPKTWSWMNCENISVTPNYTYEARIESRMENSNRSHVRLYGYNETAEKWNILCTIMNGEEGTGTHDWHEFNETFTVPSGIHKMRITLNVGSVLNDTEGNATVWFDNFLLSRLSHENVNESIVYSPSLDPKEITEGDHSLRITTNNEKPGTWSWMESEVISVAPENHYNIKMKLKMINSNRSHAKISGYDAVSDDWITLSTIMSRDEGTGSRDWYEFEKSFQAPENVSELKITLNVGNVLKTEEGNATVWFDDIILCENILEINNEIDLTGISIPKYDESGISDFSWYGFSDLSFQKGLVELGFSFDDGIQILDLSFENGLNPLDNLPYLWYPPRSKYSVSLEANNDTPFNSLKLTTNTSGTKTWSWMDSPTLVVEPDTDYLLKLDMKMHNTRGTHVNIYGYDEVLLKWTKLDNLISSGEGTGSRDWNEFSEIFRVAGDISKIKFTLNVGSVLDPTLGNSTVWFRNMGLFHSSSDRNNEMDMIVIYSNENKEEFQEVFRRQSRASLLSYEKIDSTKYTVKVSSRGPFVLGLSETHDEYWVAHIEGEGEVDSIPLDGMLNGFYFNRTGNFTITVEYKPQQWFERGLWITGISTAFSLCFLIWTYRKKWGGRLIGLNHFYEKISKAAKNRKVK